MSSTNASSECYMVTNAFGDINYSDEKRSKKKNEKHKHNENENFVKDIREAFVADIRLKDILPLSYPFLSSLIFFTPITSKIKFR